MEDQDNDNIYIYNEEAEEHPLDDSGPNFAQAAQDPQIYAKEDNGGNESAKETIGSGKIFLLLINLLLNPIEGWKSIRRNKISSDIVQKKCFLPLVSILAVCQFLPLIYSARVSLPFLIEKAVVTFVSFFFGYFCIMLLLNVIMPKTVTKSVSTDFGKVFVLMSLSTLCLFYILMGLLPMLWAILIFLPLWTVYLICRGARFFQFPNNIQISCTAILCLVIIGFPVLLEWGLGIILPHITR
ncbi:MAG: hypothetical protein K2J82_01945 [Muribaculaceae bacterium]|nr:hypothetical protein [Muribaculaceae bacterium]MDE6753355.1 hypothetical protein [Muribaculaceae bacterium]